MTEKQQQQQTKEQGQRQGHKKYWQKRGQQGRSEYQNKKKDPEEIPVLNTDLQTTLPSLRKPYQRKPSRNMETLEN